MTEVVYEYEVKEHELKTDGRALIEELEGACAILQEKLEWVSKKDTITDHELFVL